MKKVFILFLLLVSILFSKAQVNCNLKKAYAFYTVSAPGMVMTDDNGNPIPPKIDINRYIYFEWCGKLKPEIQSVLYNNQILSVTLTPVPGKTVEPGNYPGHNKEFKIRAKKCNSLWKMELHPYAGNEMPEQDCKHIVIKNKAGNKTCNLKLVKETQLVTMPRY